MTNEEIFEHQSPKMNAIRVERGNALSILVNIYTFREVPWNASQNASGNSPEKLSNVSSMCTHVARTTTTHSSIVFCLHSTRVHVLLSCLHAFQEFSSSYLSFSTQTIFSSFICVM